MTPAYSCPRAHGHRFVEIRPVYRYEPRSFLWWSWIARIVDGYLVRCVHHGCGRAWVVSLDGVHEPASITPQPAEDEPRPGHGDEEPREREPVIPLHGAVRRAGV